MRCLVPRPRPAFHHPGNVEAGEREHVVGVSTPGLHRIQVVDRIKMVDSTTDCKPPLWRFTIYDNTNVKWKRAGSAE